MANPHREQLPSPNPDDHVELQHRQETSHSFAETSVSTISRDHESHLKPNANDSESSLSESPHFQESQKPHTQYGSPQTNIQSVQQGPSPQLGQQGTHFWSQSRSDRHYSRMTTEQKYHPKPGPQGHSPQSGTQEYNPQSGPQGYDPQWRTQALGHSPQSASQEFYTQSQANVIELNQPGPQWSQPPQRPHSQFGPQEHHLQSGPWRPYPQSETQVPHPQSAIQEPHPRSGPQEPQEPRGPHPQLVPQEPHPRSGPQGPYPQSGPQGSHLLLEAQGSHPQLRPQGTHPQSGPHGPHSQWVPLGPHSQSETQGRHPQLGEQGPHPQSGPQEPHPQLGPQVPHPQLGPQGSQGPWGPHPKSITQGPHSRSIPQEPHLQSVPQGPYPQSGPQEPSCHSKIQDLHQSQTVGESVDTKPPYRSLLDLEQIVDEFTGSVVKIAGLDMEDIDEDTIDNVFSNEDQGGGEIANIEFQEDTVYVTFAEATVAGRVAKKQWSVMGQDVTVSLHLKDMDGINKLLQVALKHPSHAFIVDNVPKDVDPNYLLLRLEKTTKLNLERETDANIEAVLQHKGTKALLLLANGDPAFRMSVIERINQSGSRFGKTHPIIKAEDFPRITQVSISNIDDKKCRDGLLHDYFSNRKKSSGGSVKKVDVIGRGRAIVSFEDSSSVESTMEHNHREYLGSNVTLNPHHPLFEEWLESSKHATLGSKLSTTKKNQFTYPMSSAAMCKHVEKKHLLTFVNDKLKEHCASAELNTTEKHLIVKPKHGSEFIEDWLEKCTEAICSFFQLYSEDKVSVCEGTTDAVFRVIFRLNKQYPNVDIIEDNEESVCIVGPTQDVEQIKELIHKVVTENMDSEERESLPPAVLVYIQDCIQEELQKKYKHVMMKVLLSEGVLEVTGKSSKCQEFLTEIRKLQPSSSKVLVSELTVRMLARPLGRKYLLSKMPKGEPMTYYFTGPDDAISEDGMSVFTHLYLVANDATAVTEVADKVKGSLVSKQIPVPREFKNAERSRAWENMKKEIESRYVAEMFPNSAAGVITIVSEKSQANNVEAAVEVFKQRECYTEKTIALEHGQWKYLRDFSKEWTLLEAEIKKNTTRYKIPTGEERGPTIVLEGETTPVKKLAQRFQQLRDSISIRRREIARPGLVEHFYTQEGKKQLIGIGARYRAIVEVSTAEDQEFEEEQIAKQETHPLLISGTVGEGATVEVRKGDLTEFPVDVMVNAANEQLNHGGGIAGVISRKGGPIIQEESTKYVSRRGQVDVGKAVILNGTGNLPCKSIVHAVGPRWNGGRNNEPALLSKAVYSSLRRTEENRLQSISFPAISSGIFGVPINVCAEAMFDGICKFFEDSKYQMKVVIMLYEDKHVEEFLSAAKESLENPNPPVKDSGSGLEQHRLPDPRTPERSVSVPPPVPLRSDPKPRPAVSVPPIQPQISPATSCIEVKKGSLTDINVDVYVNTTASNLILNHGAVSKSLLKAGGQRLQDECTAHVQRHGDVKEWSFATTGPGNLKCKHVIHTVGGSYNGPGGSAEKGMEQMMTQVMKECDKLKASSVAIPSIGAGNLGFPPDALARILLETVSTYLDQNRNTSIKIVIFAIFDRNTHAVFQTAFVKSSPTKRDPAPSPVPNQYWTPANVTSYIDVKRGSLTDHKVESRKTKFESSPVVPSRTASKRPLKAAEHQASLQTTAAGSLVSVFQCNNVNVKIIQGDITEESCDGLVITASEKLTLNKVGLQGALLRKGGQELQDECKAVYERDGALSHSAVRVTGPGRRGGLKCKKVLHVLAPNKITKPRQTVKYVLDKASTLGLKSIALPVIGADEHTFDKSFARNKVVTYIYEAISEYSKRSDFTVTEVRIVSAEANYFHEFGEHFLKTGEHRGILKTFKGGVQRVVSILPRKINKRLSGVFDSFPGNTPNDNGDLESQHSSSTLQQSTHKQSRCLVISVYGSDKETVKKVIADVEVVIKDNFDSVKIIDDRVTDLSPDMMDNLRQLAKSLFVELDVYRKIITLEGQKTKVAEVNHRIKELFLEIDMMKKEESFDRERQRKERQYFEEKSQLATSRFCWQWRDQSGTFVDFDSKISFLIEQAHKENKGRYTFKNREGMTIKIDFATNQMTDLIGNTTEVKRHDFEEEREEYKKQLAEVSNPAHWVPMPVDGSGKELLWHPVTLSPTDQEYQEVLQEFKKTMNTGFNVSGKTHYNTILAIKRIQNPTLYGTYIVRRKQMNEANPTGHQNERRLFHGCPVDAVENINKTGYNRSYCGRNASAFGLGSYFSRDASYSSREKYSPPDVNGKKHTYLARVLTGEYTKGDPSMRDPPAKDAHRKYDSVVDDAYNPSIFVVFFDTQAYPEYLIEFTA